MTLNQLTYFQKIAQLEHFRLAANELNISQPSLSRSMDTLENELGIPLFEKNGRNSTLTKYGKMFLEHVDRILEEVRTAEQKMYHLTQEGGHIDIAYVSPLANHYIPHTVRTFLNLPENKQVTFSFSQSHTIDLIRGLKSDITSLNHPLANEKEVPFQVLQDYPVIGYDRDSGLGLYTHKLYRKHQIQPDIVIDCPDEYSIAALVAEDFGIALVADVDTIRDAKIAKIPISGETLIHTVYTAHMKDKYMIPATNRFVKFIKKDSGLT